MAHPFSCKDAWQIRRRGRQLRIHEAHRFLCDLRRSCTRLSGPVDGVWEYIQEAVDLTHSEEFDWRAYVACHSDEWFECLFGDTPAESQGSSSSGSWERIPKRNRIYKFEARFLRFWDEEAIFGVAGTRQRRFDFVAYRDDGKHFRLHPGTSGATETWPITGDLRSWAIVEEGGAGSALAVPPPPAGTGHPAASQENPYRRLIDEEGRDFLRRRVQIWEEGAIAADGVPRRFTMDLTSGDAFAWDLFFARDVESRQLLHGVVQCWLVWVGRAWQRAAFYIRFRDGGETVYAETSDGRWAIEVRMVEDIYWAA